MPPSKTSTQPRRNRCPMARVTGIGGVFIRARDSAALAKWYAEHLGIVEKPGVGIMFSRSDDPDPNAVTLFSIFDADDDYWDRAQPVMINFRVEGIDELIAQAEGRRRYGFRESRRPRVRALPLDRRSRRQPHRALGATRRIDAGPLRQPWVSTAPASCTFPYAGPIRMAA